MNWTHVLMAAYAGAAITIVTGLMRKKGWLSKGSAAVLVAVFIALWNFIDIRYLQAQKNAQTAEARFDAMVQQVPTWQLMAEHEPKLFSELRNQVVVLMKAGANEQKIIDTIQPRFSALQMQRMPLASDQLVVAETRVLIDQTVEMQKISDDACFRFHYPEVKGGVNPVALNSRETLKRRLDTDYAMLQSTYGPDKHTITPQEKQQAQADLEPIVRQLYSKYGQDVQLLSHPDQASGKEKVVCDMMLEILHGVQALPQERAAGLYRSLMLEASRS
ncbi:hypothetical protein SAMN04487787_102124 [Kosakonia sacchari]|nr:hypothetical protein SAMN04487787_102124 [Kosakonia sacchari]